MSRTTQKDSTSQLGAILEHKCPQCRKGNMFIHPLYKLHKFTKMYEYCPHCGIHYEPEPGFYFGAMYISYAFNIALLITLFVATNILMGDVELWVYFVNIIIPSILLVPLNFRLSRALMLHLFGGYSYNPEKAEKS